MGLLEGLIIRLVIAIVGAIVGLIAAWFVLRTFDASSQIDFKKAFDKMEQDAKAIALYFGLRFLGVAILIGFIIGKALGF